MYTLVCRMCGQEFQARMPHAKVCEACKNRPCEICGKPFKHVEPYDQRACSPECRHKLRIDPKNVAQKEAKKRASLLEKYGVDNVSKLPEVRKKISEANTLTEDEIQSREAAKIAEREARNAAKEKERHQRELEAKRAKLRYCKLCGKLFMPTSGRNFYCKRDHHATCKVCGEDYIIKYADLPYPRNVCYNPECGYEWRKIRNLEMYGVENSGNLPQFAEKRKQTNLKKFGVDNPFKSEEIKQKIYQTNFEKYGFEYSSQNPELREKQRSELEAQWKENLHELVKKRTETCLKKYGVSNPRKLPEIEAKIRATNLERYGSEFPNTERLHSILSQRKAMLKRVSKVNLDFKNRLNAVGWDAQEEFNIENKWYDLWTEGSPILVEVDPTYTHYTDGKQMSDSIDSVPPTYQLEKSELADKYGFHCVHVFDWDDKYQIVQLLRNDRKLIYARKCKVFEIGPDTARDFESIYHLQGPVKGQVVCLGLSYEDKLVEVMTFGRPRYNKNYQWELLRLCTQFDYTVVGGASKLFKYFLRTYNPDSIISYCDRAKFSGDVYRKIGMTLHHTTDPARIWSKGTKKITDNLLRQRGYDQLFGTHYGKGTSNVELMIENNWHSVYDCGQFVFEWQAFN